MNKSTTDFDAPRVQTREDENNVVSFNMYRSMFGSTPTRREPNPNLIGIQSRSAIETETIPTSYNARDAGFTVTEQDPFALNDNETTSLVDISREDRYAMITGIKEKINELPDLLSDYVIFGVTSEEMKRKIAVSSLKHINNPKNAGALTINDPRMGVVPPYDNCHTCRLGLSECPGHFGRIKFHKPIYHPLFINAIEQVMSCVCKDCGTLLLTKTQLESAGLNVNTGYKKLKNIADFCKKKGKEAVCPSYRNLDKTITNINGIEMGPVIPCSRNPTFDSSKADKDRGKLIMKVSGTKVELRPEDAYDTLNMISDEDKRLLGFDENTHPRDLILQSILVIPPAYRGASISVPGTFAVDKYGIVYMEIIKKNNQILEYMKGQKDGIEDMRTELYKKYAYLLLHNGDVSDNKKNKFTGILTKFQTKKGILRRIALGKRVDFTGRSVIDPNPFLNIEQIGVPYAFQSVLTTPITVRSWNIRGLVKLLRSGKVTSVVRDDKRIIIKDNNRSKFRLKIGDICNRWMRSGDTTLLNRQPSIHKQNIMAHEIVLVDALNIQMNQSATSPYNADFDGDEMNLHVPQLAQARAEAKIMMSLKHCLMNEQMNAPMVGLIMSDVTGGLIMTMSKTTVVDPITWLSCISVLQNTSQLATFEDRISKAGIDRRSGKALFSVLLPEYFYYKKGDVLIKDGILLSGSITKKDIGRSRNNIIQSIHMRYGKDRALGFLNDADRLINRWFSTYGYSIGLESCTHTDPKVQEIKEEEMAKMKMMVAQAGSKLDDPVEEEKRQREILGYLSNTSNATMSFLKDNFSKSNALAQAIISGSKGSIFNYSQINVQVGPQYSGGGPIPATLTDQSRIIPTQEPDDYDPTARGFVVNSWSEGLTPSEMFYHQIGTRENLVDTAARTPDVGKLSRELNIALSDYVVLYDGSVRNSNNEILQGIYGGDGFSPAGLTVIEMNGDDMPFFMDVTGTIQELNSKYGYEPFEISDIPLSIMQEFEGVNLQIYVPVTNNYQIGKIIDNKGRQRIETYLYKFVRNRDQIKKILDNYEDDPSLYEEIKDILPEETDEDEKNRSINRDRNRADEYSQHFKTLTNINEAMNEIDDEYQYLDIGCGTCIFTENFGLQIGFYDYNIHGLDVKWREAYKRYTDNIEFTEININDPYPYNDNQFKVISAIMTLHHIDNIDFVLGEIKRVMINEGYLVIREHDATNDIDKMIIDVEHMIYDSLEGTYNDETRMAYVGKYKSKKEWMDLLGSYGFELVGDGNEYLATGKRSETRPYYAIYQLKKNKKKIIK